MNDLISVIVPVYNSQQYIGRCIESLINQTYKNLEIILINDGSTDNSLKIIREYEKQDKRIIVIDKKNEGVSRARNAGLEICTGKYITFVDSDDWIDKETYEQIHNIFLNYNVEIVRFNYCKNKTDKEIIYKGKNTDYAGKKIEKEEVISDIIPYVLEDKIQALICTFMYSAKLKNSFNSKIHLGEDKLFCLELLFNAKSVYFCNEPFYHYYYNRNSANFSNLDYKKNLCNFLELYKEIDKCMLKYNTKYDYRKILNNFICKWSMTNLWIIYKAKKGDKNFCTLMYKYILEDENLKELFKKSDLKKLSFFDNKTYIYIKKEKLYLVMFWLKIRYILLKIKK